MTVMREEFDAALRELKETVDQHTADLKTQFERIAQVQAELDSLRMASQRRSRKRKSTPSQPAFAADQQR